MQTECPHCKTLFRITDTQLRLADGMVRCGLCRKTFNALHPDGNSSASTTHAPDAMPDLFDDGFFGDQARDVVPETFRHAGMRTTVWSSLGWGIAMIVLALALLAQITWFERNSLQENAQLKPWVEKFCKHAGCRLDARRDPSKIEMLSRNVYTHPNEKNALMITISIANHAEHAQPYPDVQIDFSNVRGGIVAARRFTPVEYLASESAGSALLPAGSDASFTLEIRDPGKQALTYEFSFL